MEKEIYDERNGLYYTLCGDYYLPNLVLPEERTYRIGKYGQMRRRFLKEHQPGIYEALVLPASCMSIWRKPKERAAKGWNG